MRPPLTTASDRSRPMPAALDDRLDRIEAALATLGREERRLGRLGFERPLARVHHERRYWEFLRAIHRLAAGEPDSGGNA